ncbi:MAG: hypothetical protein GKR87_09375 [Kiritimatiellae bacterium]|nr:hypothetical protein [Kiritimatiellia bacterium]
MHIIAHRGASQGAPENTIAAIRLAWDQAADGVELDLRLTKDGKIVVIHDASTQRTACEDVHIADQDFEQLQKLDAGSWWSDRWKKEKIPSLEETLNFVPKNKHLFLDIKCGEEIAPALKHILEKTSLPRDNVVFVGKDLTIIQALKKSCSLYRVLYSVSHRKNGKRPIWAATIDHWISQAVQAGLDGLGLDARTKIDPYTIKAIKDSRVHLFAWTVDSPKEVQRLQGLDVTSLATNCPGLVKPNRDRAV